MRNYILCCDWGTTSLRIRLVNLEGQEIVGETSSNHGIAYAYDQYSKRSTDHELKSRIQFYLAMLKEFFDRMEQQYKIDLKHLPVVISGMASSTLGIMELPYAALPFSLKGDNAVWYRMGPSELFPHLVILLSGVRGQEEVMRGEEVQLLGIMEIINLLPVKKELIVLLPGTHSKHVHIKHDQVTKIETYITGELFSIMSNNGLLKESVRPAGLSLNQKDWDIFREGIACSGTTNMLQALFKVRTNQLFGRFTKQQNYTYLSGLLIGYELKELLNKDISNIVLCSESELFEHYKYALKYLGLYDHAYLIGREEAKKATIKGQLVMANKCLHQEQSHGNLQT